MGEREPSITTLIALVSKKRTQNQGQLAIKKLAEVAALEPDRLEAISSGERPTDEDLAKLAQVLTKDDGSLWSELELKEIRAKEFPCDR